MDLGTPTARIPFKHSSCLFSGFRHKCLFGGRNGAKSWSVATYLVIKATEAKHKIVCARQHWSSIQNSSKSLIERRIEDLGLSSEFWITERSIVHIYTGAMFIFVGLEKSIESIKYLEGATIVWIEAAQTISMRSLETLVQTIRDEGSEFILTWNQQRASDKIEKMFRGVRPRADAMLMEVNYWDHDYVSAAALAEIENLRETNEALWRHIYCGEYISRSIVLCFPNAEVGRPLDEQIAEARISYGLDFGFTDPSALLKVLFMPSAKIIHIAAEAYGSGVSYDQMPEFLDQVVRHRGALVWADSSAPGTIELLESRGHGVRKVKKNTIQKDLIWMNQFKILIDPSCVNTIREFGLYSYPVDRLTGERMEGLNPVDKFNHCADACRYALTDEIANSDGGGGERWDNGGVFRVNLWGPRRY
jgi:phage terminase large subunit